MAAEAEAAMEAPASMDVEAESIFHRQLLELASLLARGGAIGELAALSVSGMAHGEALSPAEALALHVKALDLMSCGLALSGRLATSAPPPRLEAALGEALSQAEHLRGRFAPLLSSAEMCRAAASQYYASQQQLMQQQPHAGSRQAAAGGGAAVRDPSCAGSAHGLAAAPAAMRLEQQPSVCVEELLYRQALCMGREAAVDELLEQYEASEALYRRAKLTLEQLATEPVVGEADRAILLKYSAGFAWRLHEMRSKMLSGASAPPTSASLTACSSAAVPPMLPMLSHSPFQPAFQPPDQWAHASPASLPAAPPLPHAAVQP